MDRFGSSSLRIDVYYFLSFVCLTFRVEQILEVCTQATDLPVKLLNAALVYLLAIFLKPCRNNFIYYLIELIVTPYFLSKCYLFCWFSIFSYFCVKFLIMTNKFVNTSAVHFPYKVKLRLFFVNWSVWANQIGRNAITATENLLISTSYHILH